MTIAQTAWREALALLTFSNMEGALMWMLVLVFLLASFSDDGNGFDPHGGRATATTTCTDEGSGLDPHGKPCRGGF